MKSIIEQIYLSLSESDRFLEKCKESTEESEAYDSLHADLSDAQKRLFNDWEDMRECRHCRERQESFDIGFKTGIRLAFEILESCFDFYSS